MTLRYESDRDIEIQRAERQRCVGLVLAAFAEVRNFPEFAERLDRLANEMEHPDLQQLETAAESLTPSRAHPDD